MINFYEVEKCTQNREIEYISAQDQRWDKDTVKQLWDEYNVIFMPDGVYSVHPIKIIENENNPLIAIGSEDDGTIRFEKYYDSYKNCFSYYWLEGLIATLQKAREKTRDIVNTNADDDLFPVLPWKEVIGAVTPGGDPAWKCPCCGGSYHIYGIEHINNRKDKCENCQVLLGYPWELPQVFDEE